MTMEQMEAERDRMYWEYIKAIGTPEEKVLQKKLEVMDECMDAYEQYEAELEDTNEAINWDEWMIDQRIDDLRDRDAMMAHER